MDVEAGYSCFERIKARVARRACAGVMGAFCGFGGMFALSNTGVKEPVLISGTDGVGTKHMLDQKRQVRYTMAQDCVAMCEYDICCMGAEPLFSRLYVATGKKTS